MTPNPKTALIAGATGLVGGFCLRQLLDEPFYSKVIVLARRKPEITHPKLDLHIIDFDHSEAVKNIIHADDFFCCLGTTIKQAGSREAFFKVDHDYPLTIARMAVENGASQVLVVSAMGADARSSIFYNRVKGQMEDSLKALPYASVNIFRPSLLLGPRKEYRFGERLAIAFMKPLSFLFAGPIKKYRPIQAEKVAAAMIAVAKRNAAGVHIFESDRIALEAGTR